MYGEPPFSLLGIDWVGNPNFSQRRPESRVVGLRSSATRGYYWPELQGQEFERLEASFYQAFPQAKEHHRGSSGPNSEKISTSYRCPGAGGTFHAYYFMGNQDEYCQKLTAIPTPALLQFWRGQGYPVYPLYEMEIELLNYFPQP